MRQIAAHPREGRSPMKYSTSTSYEKSTQTRTFEHPIRVSVIVPTYQERGSIGDLIEQTSIVMKGWDYEIVVVDDDSPDGTAEHAASFADRHPVRVITRQGIRGLGSAVIEGCRHAEGTLIAVVDADLQHPPEVVPRLAKAIEDGADIAVASRYVDGGGVKGWSLLRRLISRGAILLARPLTDLKDPMSGCFMLTRPALVEDEVNGRGYKLLLEILVKSHYNRATEVPYIFECRRNGKSKLGAKEYARYSKLLLELYLYKLSSRLRGRQARMPEN